MPILKRQELEALSENDLRQKMEELKTELMKDNSQVASGTVPKSPGKLRNNKKNIARILTVINEKTSKKEITGTKSNNEVEKKG